MFSWSGIEIGSVSEEQIGRLLDVFDDQKDGIIGSMGDWLEDWMDKRFLVSHEQSDQEGLSFKSRSLEIDWRFERSLLKFFQDWMSEGIICWLFFFDF